MSATALIEKLSKLALEKNDLIEGSAEEKTERCEDDENVNDVSTTLTFDSFSFEEQNIFYYIYKYRYYPVCVLNHHTVHKQGNTDIHIILSFAMRQVKYLMKSL